MLISCEVRKPSKKCRNGTRARSVAAWATSAKSCASWTEPAASIAQPVVRACITSLWSPKIDSAWVAIVRAATWMTAGVSSPAILNMFGIISSRPCDAVNVVAERALLECAVQRAGGARLGLHLDDVGDLAPQIRPARRGPVVAVLRHRRGRRDRVDRDHLADGVGDAGRGLVAVQALVLLVHVRVPFSRSAGARSSSGKRGRSRRRAAPRPPTCRDRGRQNAAT